MLTTVYTRFNGRWVLCGVFSMANAFRRFSQLLKDMGQAHLVTEGDGRHTIEEWYPDNYDHNPRTNGRELQIGSDTHKRRFPGVRRRAAR